MPAEAVAPTHSKVSSKAPRARGLGCDALTVTVIVLPLLLVLPSIGGGDAIDAVGPLALLLLPPPPLLVLPLFFCLAFFELRLDFFDLFGVGRPDGGVASRPCCGMVAVVVTTRAGEPP